MKCATVSEFLAQINKTPKPRPVAQVRRENGELWRAIHRLLQRKEEPRQAQR